MWILNLPRKADPGFQMRFEKYCMLGTGEAGYGEAPTMTKLRFKIIQFEIG